MATFESAAGQGPSLQDLRASFQRLTDGENATITIWQVKDVVRLSADLLTDDISTLSETEVGNRLDTLRRLESQLDAVVIPTDMTGAMTPKLNFQRGEARNFLSSVRSFLQEQKQHTPKEQLQNPSGFDGEAFEAELINKPEFKGEFADLQRLKETTSQFIDGLALLKDSYFPENVLTDSSLSDPQRQSEIARALTGIDTDIRRIQAISDKLKNRRDLLGIALSNVDQSQIKERQNYFQTTLLNKLQLLQNEMLEKRARFQETKDQLTTIDIVDVPSARVATEMMMKVYKEAKAGVFTTLPQFLALRKAINDRIALIDLKVIASELQSAKGISVQRAELVTNKIQKEVVDYAPNVLKDLDTAIITFWKDRFIKDAATAPEFVALELKIAEKTVRGRSSSQDVELMRQILSAREALSDKKGVYLSVLPDTVSGDASQEIDRRLQRADQESRTLLAEAKTKVKGEIETHPQIADVIRKINVTTAATEADITAQQTALLDAKTAANRNAILSAFPSELNNDAITAYEAVMGDDAKNKGQVGAKLTEFRNAVDALRQVVRDASNTRINEVVRRIISIVPTDVPRMTLQQLLDLQEELRVEIQRAASVQGNELNPTTYKDAKERIDQYIKEKKEAVDIIQLRKWIAKAESSDQYMSGTHSETVNTATEEALIKDKVSDPVERQRLLDELNARAALNDISKDFRDSQFYIDKLHSGYGYINGRNFEVLFHEMQDVKQLVPLALTLFELALRGKLEGFPDCTSSTWGVYKNDVQAKISGMLGPQGELAVHIAERLVHASGMIPYYEEQFKATRKMEMRDIGKLEHQRESYGDPSRLDGAGIRAHGPDNTVGKYWNEPGAVGPTGKLINPVYEATYEEGEPYWDMFPDFWNYTPLLDGKKQIYEGNDLVTLARNNRYATNEAPDFTQLIDEGLLTEDQVQELEDMDWHNAVRYMDIHFTAHDRDGRTVKIKDESMNEFVEQMQSRKKLAALLLKADWKASEFDLDWFDENKTTFDYLANTGHVIRDIADPDERNIELRRFQTVFLLGVLKDHAVGIAMEADWWEPVSMLVILDRAVLKGFINETQREVLEKICNLEKEFGPLTKASRISILRKAGNKISTLK